MDQVYHPLVSIITPTYNHEKYIQQCIESVLSQTYPHWEQIIVDDGSIDDTPRIVAKYTRDPRIKYIRMKHLGIQRLYVLYNKALQIARGELIAILEGDDYWPPYKLEKQIQFFQDPQVVLTWGKGVFVDNRGRILGKSRVPNFQCLEGPRVFRKLLVRNIFTPAVTVMIRKKPLLREGFAQPKNVPCVDYPTWFRLAKEGKFCLVDEILGYWRIHSAQMSKRLWQMRKGEIATFVDLWQRGDIPFVALIGLVPFSIAKHCLHVVKMKRLASRHFD